MSKMEKAQALNVLDNHGYDGFSIDSTVEVLMNFNQQDALVLVAAMDILYRLDNSRDGLLMKRAALRSLYYAAMKKNLEEEASNRKINEKGYPQMAMIEEIIVSLKSESSNAWFPAFVNVQSNDSREPAYRAPAVVRTYLDDDNDIYAYYLSEEGEALGGYFSVWDLADVCGISRETNNLFLDLEAALIRAQIHIEPEELKSSIELFQNIIDGKPRKGENDE